MSELSPVLVGFSHLLIWFNLFNFAVEWPSVCCHFRRHCSILSNKETVSIDKGWREIDKMADMDLAGHFHHSWIFRQPASLHVRAVHQPCKITQCYCVSHLICKIVNEVVSAGDTAISLNTPVPFTILHEKFQFWGGGILGKLRTEVHWSSMRSSNWGGYEYHILCDFNNYMHHR